MHPIIIANPKPFRLILRDENDYWKCSTEELTKGSYNYVRLHRATRFIDVGLVEPFTLCLAYDGSLILPMIEQYAGIDSAIDEFNRVVASCFIGGLYIEAVTPADISYGHIVNCGYFRHEHPLGDNAEFHRSIGQCGAGVFSNIKLFSPQTILADDFEKAFNVGNSILKLVPSLSPTLFVTAFTYYLSAQYREALTHAWISVEQLIHAIWDNKIISTIKGGSIPKRRKFMESQQWTLAHKVELMFNLGLVDEDLYSKLNTARFERNEFQHTGKAPTQDSCKAALYSVSKLLGLAVAPYNANYDVSLINKYLEQELRPIGGGFSITNYKNVTEDTASHWMRILPLPGFNKWDSEFEKFDDIQLQKL